MQQRQAQELHRQAGVAEGPSAIEELRQFQQALGPQYQLLVVTRMKLFFLIFKGPAAPHQIRLLKSNHHFHGCTSFPAFVNLSYYCLDCERGFNTNDRSNHTCQGNRCSACGRFDFRDYGRGTRPTDYCTLCHCKFYSVYCIIVLYADFEAMQNAEGVFVANLLCCSSTEEEAIHVLEGEDCALQFLHDLDDLVDVSDSDQEREIIVVFHNLKGFDGMFILHELYQQQ